MIWAGISDNGKSNAVFIEGNMTGRRYIDQVLRPEVVPFAQNHGTRFILMDDNARPHRANIVRDFLANENIARMDPWPACSPDLNPIEHCWDQIGRAVSNRRVLGDTIADLRRHIEEEWANITQAKIQRLVRSMRRRCQACIATNGAHTRY